MAHRADRHDSDVPTPTAEYDLAETVRLVGPGVFEQLNSYHLERPLCEVAHDPVPARFLADAHKTDPDIAERITHDRSKFDPALEAAIKHDRFMRRLNVLRSTMEPLQYAIAKRSRHTTLAALALSRTSN